MTTASLDFILAAHRAGHITTAEALEREQTHKLIEKAGRRGRRLTLVGDWPPPGFWRDARTGREWRATEREPREANRLLAKHRDVVAGRGARATEV